MEVFSQACPKFVELVEAGITSGPDAEAIAREYLTPLQRQQVDTLVLGCTHYPLLTGVISYVMGQEVTLVSSAEETAKDVYRELAAHQLLRSPDAPALPHRFQATGDPAAFRQLARRFLGPEVIQVEGIPQLSTSPTAVLGTQL